MRKQGALTYGCCQAVTALLFVTRAQMGNQPRSCDKGWGTGVGLEACILCSCQAGGGQ